MCVFWTNTQQNVEYNTTATNAIRCKQSALAFTASSKATSVKTTILIDVIFAHCILVMLKMTVRGTMVRSEVCKSWCYC